MKTKIRFRRMVLMNRWKRAYGRSGDWVIIGIQQWWASPDSFCYKLCFFGFDLQIWFKKTYIE